jgi:biopolymer transport protein ExbD
LNFRRTIPSDDEGVPMSSMADIVFLLIIFFMLTTVFASKRGIEIELPQTESGESVSPQNITIIIDAKGDIYLDEQKTELENLGRNVVAKRSQQSGTGIIVEADGNVEYRQVMDVLDELLLVGVTNISLPTVEEKKEMY